MHSVTMENTWDCLHRSGKLRTRTSYCYRIRIVNSKIAFLIIERDLRFRWEMNTQEREVLQMVTRSARPGGMTAKAGLKGYCVGDRAVKECLHF